LQEEKIAESTAGERIRVLGPTAGRSRGVRPGKGRKIHAEKGKKRGDVLYLCRVRGCASATSLQQKGKP